MVAKHMMHDVMVQLWCLCAIGTHIGLGSLVGRNTHDVV